MKTKLLNFIKIGFIFLAFYIVYQKTDFNKLMNISFSINYWYIFIAFVLYNLSMFISALRLELFIKSIGISIQHSYSFKLHYVGLFYNTFLLGGISGDIYKVYKLKNSYKIGYKILIKFFFIDRLNGLFGLFFVLGLVLIISQYDTIVISLGILLSILALVFAWLMHFMFQVIQDIYLKTIFFSIIMQILQALTMVVILYGLGQEKHIEELVVLLLISSIFIVLPLSIGSVGVRELTFVYGLEFLELDVSIGVLSAFIFFIISLFTSLLGGVYLKNI